MNTYNIYNNVAIHTITATNEILTYSKIFFNKVFVNLVSNTRHIEVKQTDHTERINADITNLFHCTIYKYKFYFFSDL